MSSQTENPNLDNHLNMIAAIHYTAACVQSMLNRRFLALIKISTLMCKLVKISFITDMLTSTLECPEI